MAALGKLTVELEANMARFQQEMTKSAYVTEQAMNKMQKSADTAKAAIYGLGAGMASAFSVGMITGAIGKSIDALAKLDDMAQKTGSSVENLSKLGKVATAFGTDFNDVDAAMIKLAKGMNGVDEEGSKVTAGLAALGISTKNLKDQDPSEVFVQIARKLQDYKDGASKAALMTDILGKSGANLLPYMNDVAESLDKFKSDSNEAAAAAAAYQDQLGMLKVKHDELVTTIVGSLLPPMTDLVTAFNDSQEGADGLANTNITSWADDLAVGIARVVDVAKILPGLFTAIQGSFKVVMADAEVAGKVALNLNPGVRMFKWITGGDASKDIKDALEARNKTVAAANKAYDDLWNKPGNTMEQSVLAAQAARAANAGNRQEDARNAAMMRALTGQNGDKKTLNYSGATGSKGGKSDAEKLAEDATKFIAKLKEEAETFGKSAAAVVEYQAKKAGFSESVQEEAVALATQIEQLKLADEARKGAIKAEKEAIERAQQKIASEFESIASMEREIEIYDMLPAAITRAEVAKLELYKATLEANEGTEGEIRVTEALIAAKTRLAGLQDTKAAMDEQKKAAEESKKIQDNFIENMQRNLGNGLFDMMNGNFKNIGDSFKRLMLRMIADATAANIMQTLFASNGTGKGALGGGLFGLISQGLTIANAGSSSSATGGMGIMGADVMNDILPSAAGGFDIPAGVNPLTQLHEREMVLPAQHADVIRSLASGGRMGGDSVNLSPVYNIQIDSRSDRNAVMADVQRAVANGNAQLVEKLSRKGLI